MNLDREKVEQARSLINAGTMSETIDIALDRLIRAEELRHDVAAYRREPNTVDEAALADMPIDLDLDDDDVDYDALYGR